MICPFCESETEGTRGPATGCLTPLCSNCRKIEDAAEEVMLSRMSSIMDMVANPPKVQELETVA